MTGLEAFHAFISDIATLAVFCFIIGGIIGTQIGAWMVKGDQEDEH